MHLARRRHELVLRELELRGSLRSAEMAAHLGISEVTMRRDLLELERAGRLRRVHGGAIAVGSTPAPRAARVLVGLVVPNATSYFPSVVRGMEAVAPRLRVRLVLGVSQYRHEAEVAQVDRLIGLGVSGLAIAPTAWDRTPAELASWLRAIPVPLVLVERQIEGESRLSELDLAHTDHVQGAVLAVEHLHGLGHRRIALAVFERTPTAPRLRQGFATAVDRLGIEPGPDVALRTGEDGDPLALAAEIEELFDRCRQAGATGIVVHTDHHAARLVEVAIDRGMRVPDDLAIVAYDDENAELAVVPLTTISPPRREIGEESLRILVDRMHEDGDGRRPPRHLSLLPRLTVRASCGASSASLPGPGRLG
ncbi:substrate-binding domain-containing protein [Promicromonospora sp. NPDC057488]|uniref:substrate-binding domain-containing protein n=1 Tax=Promicromonospora sp. NPDC057488 TaxID=3346147 RepID=UPI003671F8B9